MPPLPLGITGVMPLLAGLGNGVGVRYAVLAGKRRKGWRAQLTTCPWALARHRTSLAVHSNVLCYPKVCVRLAICQRPLAGKFQYDD